MKLGRLSICFPPDNKRWNEDSNPYLPHSEDHVFIVSPDFLKRVPICRLCASDSLIVCINVLNVKTPVAWERNQVNKIKVKKATFHGNSKAAHQ